MTVKHIMTLPKKTNVNYECFDINYSDYTFGISQFVDPKANKKKKIEN
jgi:hypothetical protein